MSKRACIYARYSSDLQNAASIEDQIRLCSQKIEAEQWQMVNCYTDAAMSGASLMRPGIQALITAALQGEFDIVVAEALDRLSRDQEDIAGIYKRMEFAGVKLITLSEGEISTLHIGLKGTMNAMFLKDLADKTRRGLRGKVEQGKSGGGLSYGYRVIKEFDSRGEIVKGEREINAYEASIVQRIFKEYAFENRSPKAIAAQLNEEGVPCPSGKAWGQSTINGNRKRGTGILNNELYIGRLVWNRQRYIKDPATGKRVTRMNPEHEWVIQDVPELAILDIHFWDAAKARQRDLDRLGPKLWQANRPKYLLSGLLKCGCCHGGFSKINSTHYGCSTYKNKGKAVCDNALTIRRDKLEGLVLNAIQNRLMREELLDVFCAEYTKHINELTERHNAHRKQLQKSLENYQLERENLVKAIKSGMPVELIQEDLEQVSNKIKGIEHALAHQSETKLYIHPSMAQRYSQAVQELRQQLTHKDTQGEASEIMRTMIERIELGPKENKRELQIDLFGNLAGILNVTSEDKNMIENSFLERFELSSFDNSNLQDRVGCGSRI